jgi:glycerol-3-phosphate acyltransferase PlsY
MERGISISIGYLIGCFQTAFILGKLLLNVDIRQHGSGNSGTTNALRVLGWKAGFLTFFGDFLKAILAVVLIRLLFDDALYTLYAGFGVVLGHNFPVFMKFKGGKGIAASAGALLAFDYRIGLISMLVMIVVVFFTRYVSLGSLFLATWIPIGIYIFYPQQWELLILGICFMILAFVRHQSNIKRLLSGEENKLGKKKTAI